MPQAVRTCMLQSHSRPQAMQLDLLQYAQPPSWVSWGLATAVPRQKAHVHDCGMESVAWENTIPP